MSKTHKAFFIFGATVVASVLFIFKPRATVAGWKKSNARSQE